MKRLRFLFPALMIGAVALAAGCRGGGSLVPPPATAATPPASVSFSIGASPATEVLKYGDYTLSFTVPGLVAPTPTPGNPTITAVIGATPPSSPAPGVPIPAARSVSFDRGVRGPSAIGVQPVTPLLYLTVATNAMFVFAQEPSFTVTSEKPLPIPSGWQAYMALYDPAPAQGSPQWQVVTQAGSLDPSGKTISFAGANRQVIFNPTVFAPPAASLPPYTFALVTIPSGPSPSCAQPPFRNAATAGLTLNLTDSSGLKNTVLVVYVLQQANPGSPISWMDGTGAFGNQAPVPIPASCYSTTVGSGASNNPLTIAAGHQGRIFIVEATPAPIGWVPNPFGGHPTGWTPTATENFMYDKLEYNSTNGVIDTTQVDFLGLPIEMNAVQGTASATPLPAVASAACPSPVATATPFSGIPTAGVTTVGVGQCAYAAIFQALAASANWKNLVDVHTYSGNANIDFRAYNPAQGPYFDQNLLGDTATLPTQCSQYQTMSAVQAYGYVGCLLVMYKQHPQAYESANIAGAPGSGDAYCVTSDGVANFIATDIGRTTAPNCTVAPTPTPKPPTSKLSSNPFAIPATLLTNADTQQHDLGYPNCNTDLVFSAPYGTAEVDEYYGTTLAGHAFSSYDAFLLWKGMVLEMNYGTATANAPHPIETTPPTQQFVSGQLFVDPLYNYFDQLTHAYFDGTYSYGMPYDDGFSWYSGYNIVSPGTLNVRINPVPTFAGTPPILPAATPSPPPCRAYPPDVGSYAVPTPTVTATP